MRLAEALTRCVGPPVDPLEARAVLQMEARHRVDRLAVGASLPEVARAEAGERSCQSSARRRIVAPAPAREQRPQGRSVLGGGQRRERGALLAKQQLVRAASGPPEAGVEPDAKPRNR